MDRDDWIGVGVSLLLHALIIFGLSQMQVKEQESPTMGFVEVDFGTFTQGRPVSQAQNTRPAPPQPEPEKPAEEQKQVSPPEVAKPVVLPETKATPVEKVEKNEAEVISPVAKPDTKAVERSTEAETSQPIRPLGSGDPKGATTAETGEEGTGTDETKRAPFQIEGLNRQAVQTTLPRYTEQVNAVIRVQITVAPSGRITRRLPLIKGNPALEEAVMNALLNWRFNPLPPNAPQENQTGVVTFRFQLR